MRARHTAITALDGSLGVSLSAPAPGTAASTDAASTDPAFTGADGMDRGGMVEVFMDAQVMATMVAGDTVIAGVLPGDQLVAASVAASHGVVSTAADAASHRK